MAALLFVGVFCLNSGALGHAQMPSEVVFIDPSVLDAEKIVAQLPEGAEVVRLSPGMDGIAQISAHLAKKRDLSAIRIISHGNAGYFVLNGKRIDGDFLRDHGDRVAPWGRALTDNGDILIYACNLAATDEGKAFVERFAGLTDADVAASTDLMGARQTSDHGLITDNCSLTTSSSWRLEYAAGLIESHAINIYGYPHHLANQVVDNDADAGVGTTLREAIAAVGDSETITFNIPGSDTINITTQLLIDRNMTINGYNSATNNNITVQVTIPGTSSYRVFEMNQAGKTVTIENMTIKGGNINEGGGIKITSGTGNLDNVTVSNSVSTSNGGGIYNAGTLTLINSTVSGNTTNFTGGGIYNAGTLTLINSTVSGNTSQYNGGGIYNKASGKTVTIDSCTIANNTAANSDGGGIYLKAGTLTVKNSILANNTANGTADDYFYSGGTLIDNGYNFVETTNVGAGSGGFTNGTNNAVVGIDPTGLASSLTYEGGYTQVLKVTTGNIASGNAGSTSETTDQRGYYRTFSAVTRGAYQYNGVVAKIGDATDWNTGTFGTDTFALIGAAYTAASSGDTIELAGTAILESGVILDESKTVTIRRDNAVSSSTYVQAAQTAGTASDRVFDITAGTVTLENMTIRNGNAGGTDGGGIYFTGASLNLDSVTVTGSKAHSGGGIYVLNATATITNSTISGNTAVDEAGGIRTRGTSTLTITNTTIANNHSDNDDSGGEQGGGIYNQGTLTVKNSIIANNYRGSGTSTEDDYYYSSGTLTDSGYNVVTYSSVAATATGGFNATTDILYNTKYGTASTNLTAWSQGGTDLTGTPTLGLSSTLALNGSTSGTYTLSLAEGSFAAASATTGIPSAGTWNGSPAADQRGVARIASQNTSIGAYSANYVPVSYEYQTKADGNWNCVTTGSEVWERRVSGSSDAWVTVTDSGNLPNYEDESITVKHDVTVTEAVTIDQTTVDTGGSLIISTGVTLTIANGEGTDLTVNGTLDMDGGTLTNNGLLAYGASSSLIYSDSSASQSTTTAELPASGAANLTINNSNGVTLGGTTSISGNLTLTSGTFNAGDNNFTATGNATGSGTLSISTGTVDVDGTFNVSGAVIFTGPGNLKLGGTTITSLGTLLTATEPYGTTVQGVRRCFPIPTAACGSAVEAAAQRPLAAL